MGPRSRERRAQPSACGINLSARIEIYTTQRSGSTEDVRTDRERPKQHSAVPSGQRVGLDVVDPLEFGEEKGLLFLRCELYLLQTGVDQDYETSHPLLHHILG